MIIQSILDTDLYKFTTSYGYFKSFPQAEGTFIFHDRNATIYDEAFVERLHAAFDELSRLSLTDEEFEYMVKNCKFIPQNYFEWLRGFRFDPSRMKIWLDEESHLHIEASDHLYKVTLYEIAVLSTVSALCNEGKQIDMEEVIHRLEPKITLSNAEQIPFSDFGTRRRFSFEVHQAVLEYIKANAQYCMGTSNCYLAMKMGLKMIGTYPHELPMFIAAVNGGPRQANYIAMEEWVKIYDGY
ncbi:MAG: nicotinate phosphoribosyltransferase, partial [Alistipes sp.]|nr:nicotinate phosphoribosyltransferase [Alistipes sp.]